MELDHTEIAALVGDDPALARAMDRWLAFLALDPVRPDNLQTVSARLNIAGIRWDDRGVLVKCYPLDNRRRAYRAPDDREKAATVWWRVPSRNQPPPELWAAVEREGW